MRHAAALRIDHVLGLKRLFLVPNGATAGEGCYLAQPFEAALGEIALESQRARCAVVGEDLGTVPDGLREALHAARILSYRVLWFERESQGFRPPEHYPELAAACVATHDIPTLAGWWEGADIEEREKLGLLDAAGAADAWAERAAERGTLLATLGLETHGEVRLPVEVAAAIHAHVAATPSLMLLLQAEDLAGERIGVNLPGTDRERPNWRCRMAPEAATLCEGPLARAILAALTRRRADQT
jgi:glycogen operon protein